MKCANRYCCKEMPPEWVARHQEEADEGILLCANCASRQERAVLKHGPKDDLRWQRKHLPPAQRRPEPGLAEGD